MPLPAFALQLPARGKDRERASRPIAIRSISRATNGSQRALAVMATDVNFAMILKRHFRLVLSPSRRRAGNPLDPERVHDDRSRGPRPPTLVPLPDRCWRARPSRAPGKCLLPPLQLWSCLRVPNRGARHTAFQQRRQSGAPPPLLRSAPASVHLYLQILMDVS